MGADERRRQINQNDKMAYGENLPMTEYRFRHSRGYNYYTRINGVVKHVTKENIIATQLVDAGLQNISMKQGTFVASFVLATIEANATEETTMFDNSWVMYNRIEIFARKEPKPVLWRCLNPRCHGYEWKSSPRHTMGCPKCRKDKIERVDATANGRLRNEAPVSPVAEEKEVDSPRQQSFL